MTPLDAAKALAHSAQQSGMYCCACVVCGNSTPDQHEPHCPVPMLPQIVAALEAAKRVADGAHYWGECDMYHVESDEVAALAAALKGKASE